MHGSPRHSGALTSLALFLSLITAACGGAAAPTSPAPPSSPAAAKPSAAAPASSSAAAKPSTAASAAAKPAAPAASGFQAQWDALVAAAKKEGTLSVGFAPSPPIEQQYLPAFQKEFGIQVEQIHQANVTALVQKLQQEKAAGVNSTDVFFAGCALGPTASQAGLYAPIKPQLIIPDVNDPSKWANGKGPLYMDKEQTSILRLDRQVRYFFHINPDAVKATDIKNPQDLLDPKWKGKIAAADPTSAGLGQSVGAIIDKQMGDDYLKNLYLGQQVKLTTEQRILGDWIAHNSYPIGIGLPADERAGLLASGLPVAKLKLDGPITASLTSSFMLGLLDKAPHPNAAKLFVNWAETQQGMQAMVDATMTAGTRTDSNYSKLDPDDIPAANAPYTDECDWDYTVGERVQLIQKVQALLPH